MRLKIIGLDEAIKTMGSYGKKVKKAADGELEAAARDFEQRAKLAAPKDTGFLARGITMGKQREMSYFIVSAAHYSAYLEWGTGGFVKVPPELARYAILFKGQKQVAGIRPQPYFFVQRGPVQQKLEKKLNNLFIK